MNGMHLLKIALRAFLLCAALGVLTVTGTYLSVSPQLPSLDRLREIKLKIPARVYTRDAELMGEFGVEHRILVRYEDIPPLFIQAIMAAEDQNFAHHGGFDLKALLRASKEMILGSSIQTGGSTITMQVARNYLLSHEKTLARKLNEILLAYHIEKSLSKKQIMELYLNKIFLGKRSYGIAVAAQTYYGKDLKDLNLAQICMIAGLPKAPTAYNPLNNPQRALERRNWILMRMHKLGYIDALAHAEATSMPITAHTTHKNTLGHHTEYLAEMARQELVEMFGEDYDKNGYVAYTTVDSILQKNASTAALNGLFAYDKRHGYRGVEKSAPPGSLVDLEAWLRALEDKRRIPNIGKLLPAFVQKVEQRRVTAILDTGSLVVIPWENGLSQAAPYRGEDNRGPLPEKASEVVSTGDLIRVFQDQENNWHLAQVPEAQIAMVSLDPRDGAIRALVGGFNFKRSQFNRATQAQRQSGSSFKPFLYAAALETGNFTAASIINDAPVVMDAKELEVLWRPENSGKKFYGPTRLRQALYESRNLVSIRLLKAISIDTMINYAQKFGFDRLDGRKYQGDLSLALGSHEVTPMELVTAYATIANRGFRVQPHLIERVEDRNGRVLYRANPATVCESCAPTAQLYEDDPAIQPRTVADQMADASIQPGIVADQMADTSIQPGAVAEKMADTSIQPGAVADQMADTSIQPGAMAEQMADPAHAPRIMEERVAYILNDILHDVTQRGTAKRLQVLNRKDIAGKTGTTNGPLDAWFTGYTKDLVTSVWLGFDDNRSLGRLEYGGKAALPVWLEYMRTVLRDQPNTTPELPLGISTVRIDPATGLRARPGQIGSIFEIFREEKVPSRYSDPQQVQLRFSRRDAS